MRIKLPVAALSAAVLLFGVVGCGSDDGSASVDRSSLYKGGEKCKQELDEVDDDGKAITLDICDELGKKPVSVSVKATAIDDLSSAGSALGSDSLGSIHPGDTLQAVCLRSSTEQIGVIVPEDELKAAGIAENSSDIDYYTTRGGKPIAFVSGSSLEGGGRGQGGFPLWKELEKTVEKELGSDSCTDSRVVTNPFTEKFRRPEGWAKNAS